MLVGEREVLLSGSEPLSGIQPFHSVLVVATGQTATVGSVYRQRGHYFAEVTIDDTDEMTEFPVSELERL